MTDAQALVLSQALADLATSAEEMLNDLTLNLTPGETAQLQSQGSDLSDLSRQLAIAGAFAALAAAQSDFDTMTQATTAANGAVTQLKSRSEKIKAILGVLGAAITFGTALTGGALGPVLTAAGALTNAAASASR